MIVFWLLGARMSYQNARVKWSELNLMLPCAISFSFTPESPVLCFLLFGRLWKTEPCSWLFTNHELLLRYASSSRKQQRIICQTCVLFFSWFLPLSFFFLFFFLFQSVFPVKLLLMNLPWNTRSIQRFLFVILQCVQKKKKRFLASIVQVLMCALKLLHINSNNIR